MVVLLPLALAFATDSNAHNEDTCVRSSPIAASADGRLVVVANPDSGSLSAVSTADRRLPGSLSAVSTADRRLLWELGVDGTPQTVALSPDGTRAWVTLAGADVVAVVDVVNPRVLATVPVGPCPFGVVAGTARVFVSASCGDRIEVIDTEGLAVSGRVATAFAPRGLALCEETDRLFVTHFQSGQLSVFEASSLVRLAEVGTGPESNVSQSVLVDHRRGVAWLPQTRSNTTNPALLFDTTLFPIVTAVRLDTLKNDPRSRIALDIVDRPVGLPLDADLDADGRMWVVNAGSNDVSVVDPGAAGKAGHVEVEDNPRGVAMTNGGDEAWVANTLAGTVSVVDTATLAVVESVRVTELPLSPAVLNGKRLFNSSDSPRLARDQWVSCAGCHFDGGADGRTWFFRDGPRNTPSLRGAAATPPFHWSGDLDELQDVESTIRTIQGGSGLVEGDVYCEPTCTAAPPNAGRSSDLDDLAAYLETLDPPDRVDVRVGSPLTSVLRGQALFMSGVTGCASCHPPPLFTDGMRHDVGTGGGPGERNGPSMDTPTLLGLDRSGPFLHDGRATTLHEVLIDHNRDDRHGATSSLLPAQVDDLVAFLHALPLQPSQPRRILRSR